MIHSSPLGPLLHAGVKVGARLMVRLKARATAPVRAAIAGARETTIRADVLSTVVIAIVAFVLADGAASFTGFNPDESRWLSRAHYLADLRDPFGETWTDQYMTRGQPPLGSYAMGVGLVIQGRDLKTNPPWDFSLPWEVNVAIGNKPEAADLAAGRRASAAIVAATAVVLVAAARAFVSANWAVAAGAVFAVHPFTAYIGSIAMSDALFGLLIALAAWAAAAYARAPDWRRAALVGVFLGLGGATKLSPLAVAAAFAAAGGVALIIALRHGGMVTATAFAARGLIVGVAALGVFVLSYPYLWPDPVGRTRHLFAFRAEEMAAQAEDWPTMAVPTRMEALRRVGVNFTERFNLSSSLAVAAGGDETPAPLRHVELALPLAGIVAMTAMSIRDGPLAASTLVLLVLGGQVAVTILGMRSEFDRYHVPMALLGAVAIAVALEWLWRAAGPIIHGANGALVSRRGNAYVGADEK
jgi:hypothetical protein